MALTTSQGNSRPIAWARVVFGTKNKDLPVPNLEFYNTETKERSYQTPEGEHFRQINLSGYLKSLSIKEVESYSDRENNTGGKNGKRMIAIIDDPQDAQAYGLTIDLVDGAQANRNGMQLLSSLYQHLITEYQPAEGENPAVTGRDVPIQLGLYRTPNKDKPGSFYPNTILRLPTGYDENNNNAPLFEDPQSFVRAELVPHPAIRTDSAGEPILGDDNKPLRTFKPVLDWFAGVESALTAMRTEAEEQADRASDNHVEDGDGINADQAVSAARPRG